MRCVICGSEEIKYVLTIDVIFGKSDSILEVYVCENCIEDLRNEIEEKIEELKTE